MTLSELARELGISPATVSIVRQGKAGVSSALRRKIQLKLEENGYSYKDYIVPEDVGPAPAQNKNKPHILLLKYYRSSLLTDKNEGFVDAIIDAIVVYARAIGYAVLINTVSQEEYASFLQDISGDSADGLVVLATEMSREEIMKLRQWRKPIIILDSDHPGLPFSTVSMDNRGIAYQAVEHLFSLKVGTVGYLRSNIRTGNFLGREIGYMEALKDHLHIPGNDVIFNLTPSLTGAYEDMKACLNQGRRVPRALFADNDIIAIGAMRAMMQHGLRIPQDVYIVGVDNTLLSQVSMPQLSSMQISRSALGQLAISTLIKQITSPTSEQVHMRICGYPIVRESSTLVKEG